jgi:hypothetical protein
MSECVSSNYKSYAENQQVDSISRRCPTCLQIFKQEHYAQRFCKDIQCKKSRHISQQIAYRQRKRMESPLDKEATT